MLESMVLKSSMALVPVHVPCASALGLLACALGRLPCACLSCLPCACLSCVCAMQKTRARRQAPGQLNYCKIIIKCWGVVVQPWRVGLGCGDAEGAHALVRVRGLRGARLPTYLSVRPHASQPPAMSRALALALSPAPVRPARPRLGAAWVPPTRRRRRVYLACAVRVFPACREPAAFLACLS